MSLAQTERPVGINLSPVQDFSTEFVFTDAFKQSRTWISHDLAGTGPRDTGINIPANENGYPLEIPYDDGVNPPQAVRALMLWDLVAPFPSGDYRLIVEGEGQVSFEFGAAGTFACPVDTIIPVSGALALRIESSLAENPITSIQFIRPEYVSTFQNQTFTDPFLEFLDDFQVLRFMDWLRTNNSPVIEWSDRSSADFFTQTLNSGVAWEYIIELANLLEKDIWINIPHQATDEYVTELSGFIEQQLNAESSIYLEYSNEVWNGIFNQSTYAGEMGDALNFTGPSWEQGWKYTAFRSAQVFEIFEEVFEDDERIVKVLPSQSANSWLSNQLITYFNDPFYNPTGISCDALAIAPYFANEVANQIVADNEVNTISVAEIVQKMQVSLSQSQQQISDNLVVALDNNLELITYEGGQHLNGTNGNENNDALTQKLTAANHHPDLEAVYCEYLDFWYEECGSLFTHFNSHYAYSKWGSWGLKETMTDLSNPKYLAFQGCVFDYNELFTGTPLKHKSIKAFPNPSTNGKFTILNVPAHSSWVIFDVTGKKVQSGVSVDSDLQIQLLQNGVFIWRSGSQAIRLVVQ